MVLVSILAGTAGAHVYNPKDEYDWTVMFPPAVVKFVPHTIRGDKHL
ncbi:MAG: hypothetical protein U9N36_02315 [Euryarchaeota archaeon]|nr:hypothetical protein [Euryarchaeota archaeon]